VNKPAIPHDALIFVGDGRKALFLRNDGDEKFPAGAHRRSSVDQTDWHHLEGTATRGNIILTSVNSPGCVLTSINPECSSSWAAFVEPLKRNRKAIFENGVAAAQPILVR
jgi:hypothetical protein